VEYDVHLITRFRSYWDLVFERRKNSPDIAMPFNALGGERDAVWKRFTRDGLPSSSKLTTRRCLLDTGLWQQLQVPEFRTAARLAMITSYFTPAEQVGLCERMQLPLPDSAEIAALAEDRAQFKASLKRGRDSRFKVEVGSRYKYTCALTGYCLQSEAGFIVQAAHIHQHARSGNNDPRNGLALTPDAHWMFDRGLWTVIPSGDQLLIHVGTNRFVDTSPHGWSLVARHGNPLHFHPEASLRPSVEHLIWHRKHHRL
jgi:putative restriction endonuclease